MALSRIYSGINISPGSKAGKERRAIIIGNIDGIGRIALLYALNEDNDDFKNKYEKKGYMLFKGQSGSMDAKKIVASIETAALRENMIKENYHEEHALYHAIIEAFSGYCRGQIVLGEVLRTTGLVFTIVRGNLAAGDRSSGEWLAIALYGQIGSPRHGFEHEAVGLGIQPV